MSMKEGMDKALYAASRTVESGKQLKRTLGHPPRRRGIYEIKPHDDNERHKHYDIFRPVRLKSDERRNIISHSALLL